MGTKIKLFNLLIIISVSTQLCAMQPWQKWVEKHQEYITTFLNGRDPESQQPYDDFVDHLYTAKNQTVAEHINAGFEKMEQEVLSDVQKEHGIPNQLMAEVQAIWQLPFEQIKSLIRDQNINAEISYNYLPSSIIKEKIEKICNQYDIRSLDIEVKKSLPGIAMVEGNNQYRKLIIGEKEFLNLSAAAQYACLCHEIGGHAKYNDPMATSLLMIAFKKSRSDKSLIGTLKFFKNYYYFYDTESVKSLRAFHEWRADQEPATKNISTNYLIRDGIIDAAISLNLSSTLPTDELHAPLGLRYQMVKQTGKLLEAEHRWMMGPKGYEKYATAYDRAFADKYGSSAPISAQKPVLSKFSKFFAQANNHFEN